MGSGGRAGPAETWQTASGGVEDASENISFYSLSHLAKKKYLPSTFWQEEKFWGQKQYVFMCHCSHWIMAKRGK